MVRARRHTRKASIWLPRIHNFSSSTACVHGFDRRQTPCRLLENVAPAPECSHEYLPEEMLATGIRTPVGLKVSGSDLAEVQRLALAAEASLRGVPYTRSVFAERLVGGSFLDLVFRRAALARHGLSLATAQALVTTAMGGETQGQIIDGRARFDISVRYARDFRDDPEALRRVLVSLPGGGQVPIDVLADVQLTEGPAMIRDENGLLTAYVYVDFDATKTDVGSYVARARAALATLPVPVGYAIDWSGQFENMLRVKARMQLVLPLTLGLIFVLLYLSTQSAMRASIVMLAVPFSAVGALWLLYVLGYNMSMAVWVGLIALMGLDAETGVFMVLFLDQAYDAAVAAGRMGDREALKAAITAGAVHLVRPKAMTVTAAFMGLLPIMWATGPGADIMKRIAAPMVGGLVSSFGLELLVYPAVYLLWRGRNLPDVPLLSRVATS